MLEIRYPKHAQTDIYTYTLSSIPAGPRAFFSSLSQQYIILKIAHSGARLLNYSKTNAKSKQTCQLTKHLLSFIKHGPDVKFNYAYPNKLQLHSTVEKCERAPIPIHAFNIIGNFLKCLCVPLKMQNKESEAFSLYI